MRNCILKAMNTEIYSNSCAHIILLVQNRGTPRIMLQAVYNHWNNLDFFLTGLLELYRPITVTIVSLVVTNIQYFVISGASVCFPCDRWHYSSPTRSECHHPLLRLAEVEVMTVWSGIITFWSAFAFVLIAPSLNSECFHLGALALRK